MGDRAAPTVAILPYGTRVTPALAHLPLDALAWPLGRPERFEPECLKEGRFKEGRVGDLGADDHLLCYISSRLLYMPRPGVRAKVSVMVVEPEAVHRRNMLWLRLLWPRFYKVLASNAALLAAIPNGLRFVFGSTWVPDWRDVDITKEASVSLIASAKTYFEGHRLRHAVVERVQAEGLLVDIIGRGYKPFVHKSDGLAPYRYSVIIENVCEPSYFSEKLIDCLLCATVPIYWGAPDIGDFFDTRGMILCEGRDDIATALTRLSEADYAARLEFVRQNREKANTFANHELSAARILLGQREGKTA